MTILGLVCCDQQPHESMYVAHTHTHFVGPPQDRKCKRHTRDMLSTPKQACNDQTASSRANMHGMTMRMVKRDMINCTSIEGLTPPPPTWAYPPIGIRPKHSSGCIREECSVKRLACPDAPPVARDVGET